MRASEAAHHVAERVATTATTATYTGAGGAVLFGLAANELAAIAGVLIAGFSAAVNWHYKRKHYALLAEQAKQEGWRE